MKPKKLSKKLLVAGGFIATIVALLLYMRNVADSDAKTAGAKASGPSKTIQQDVMNKISERVLGDIPREGRYGEILERGVLRVALPPPQPPYVMTDPTLGMPDGLFPALINEIAVIMNVKLNMETLDEELYRAAISGADQYGKYDFYIAGPGTQQAQCEALKVFYMGDSRGWMSLCVSSDGGGEELVAATKDILSYLNETGIFARIYSRYAETARN